jgi:hypothetical protein
LRANESGKGFERPEPERERERDVCVFNLVESNEWLWRHWLYFHLQLPFLFNGVSALLGGQAGSISRVLGEGGPTLCATQVSAHTQAPVLFVSAPFVVLLENVGKIEENGCVPHCTSLLVSISSTCSCWVGMCLHYVDFLWNLNYVLFTYARRTSYLACGGLWTPMWENLQLHSMNFCKYFFMTMLIS